MTAAQYYTTQFYTWEYRGRGWHVAESAIQLEPPFMPFFRHGYSQQQIDDGKRHTLLSGAIALFKGHKEPILIQSPGLDYDCLEGFVDESEHALHALQVRFPKDRKITPEKMKALLLMISQGTACISFEIIGTAKEIIIQFVSEELQSDIITTYIHAYFPQCSIIATEEFLSGIIHDDHAVAVVDFGLKNEFVRPLQSGKGFSIDPLIGILGILERLEEGEQAGIQILFQPVINRWSESILRSVTMHDGTSFFADVPEAPKMAMEKVQSPLYAVTVRAFAQSQTLDDSFYLLEKISFAVIQATKGNCNELIHLSNPDYDIATRLSDIVCRQSHRMGMLLNIDELITLVHVPSESIVSKKLYATTRKTKETPSNAKGKAFIIGENTHNGIEDKVTFSLEDRLKHTHIIGATGTGKSTLIANLIAQDIEKGMGIVLFDPHGDLVEDIIALIPEKRLGDVILVDPSDIEYPVGLNILQATSDIEKEMLSSDLVASFRRFATSWGDQMNAVFGNAILAILESTQGGTLHDLRRFLIEREYRYTFLKTVTDPSVIYYWQKEFPLLKSTSIGPILTRLDTFLRPRSIRNMVAQQKGLDFEALLNENKIVLLKLSQGLIGIENSFLLGALILSKIHQAILRRQQQANRNPVFLYLDEFQNFITPSIKEMLSGIRKYNVGLTVSHQDLQQLQREDGELLNSVLGNVNTRIVFRVGEPDAKKLQEGFSGFDYTDLQNLGRGEAVIRIEQPQYDCSLNTIPLQPIPEHQKEANKEVVIATTRKLYTKSKEQVEALLLESMQLPDNSDHIQPEPKEKPPKKEGQPITKTEPIPTQASPIEAKLPEKVQKLEVVKDEKNISTHRYLQTLVKKMAEAQGYTAVIEMQLPDGSGSVDVLLTKNSKTIAVEVCITTDADWEMHNIEKCLAAQYDTVISLSGDPKQLGNIKKKCIAGIPDFDNKPVLFLTPDALFQHLYQSSNKEQQPTEQVIKGYRVNVSYENITQEEMERKRKSVAEVVMNSLRRIKK